MTDLATVLVKTAVSLVEHEGFREKPYQDTLGVWTFGHGFTFITEEESRMVMEHRLKTDILPGVIDLCDTWETLTEARQIVLLNMAYNLGLAGLGNLRAGSSRGSTGGYRGRVQGRRPVG